MSLYTSLLIINIVIIAVLIAAIVYIYNELLNVKYSKLADKVVKQPKKRFVIPGSGVFTVASKRKCITNSDEKAYIREQNGDDQ